MIMEGDTTGDNKINEEGVTERSSIRTYERDASEALKNKDSSLSSIFIAEQKKKETIEVAEEPKGPRKWPYIIGGIVFFVAAAALVFFVWYRFFMPRDNVTPVVITNKIIVVDQEKSIDTAGLSALEIQQKLQDVRKNSDLPLGNIMVINLLASTTSNLKSETIFSRLSWRIPGKLLRSVEDDFVFGVHAFDGNQPFIVLKISSYEQAFAGMLEWEKDIVSDLGLFFGITPASTDTGTSATSTTATTRDVFVDKVIRNKDTRVLMRNNSPVLIYSFYDRKTLIITTNENTFKEIMAHLSPDRF